MLCYPASVCAGQHLVLSEIPRCVGDFTAITCFVSNLLFNVLALWAKGLVLLETLH